MELYGFVPSSNSFNSVPVPANYLGVDPEDPIAELKNKLIKEYRNQKYNFFL